MRIGGELFAAFSYVRENHPCSAGDLDGASFLNSGVTSSVTENDLPFHQGRVQLPGVAQSASAVAGIYKRKLRIR
ncbi:hypothetical protein YC2023_062375 [Brassica napus]